MKSLKTFARVALVAVAAIALIFGGMSIVPHQTTAQSLATIFPNQRYAALTATATSQTIKSPLGGFSYCTIQQTSVGLTAATWQLKVSQDGGTNYYALAMAPYVGSATLASVLTAVTTNSTSPALFVANFAGFTNVELVTSGTFTATSLSVNLTCTGNKGVL